MLIKIGIFQQKSPRWTSATGRCPIPSRLLICSSFAMQKCHMAHLLITKQHPNKICSTPSSHILCQEGTWLANFGDSTTSSCCRRNSKTNTGFAQAFALRIPGTKKKNIHNHKTILDGTLIDETTSSLSPFEGWLFGSKQNNRLPKCGDLQTSKSWYFSSWVFDLLVNI